MEASSDTAVLPQCVHQSRQQVYTMPGHPTCRLQVTAAGAVDREFVYIARFFFGFGRNPPTKSAPLGASDPKVLSCLVHSRPSMMRNARTILHLSQHLMAKLCGNLFGAPLLAQGSQPPCLSNLSSAYEAYICRCTCTLSAPIVWQRRCVEHLSPPSSWDVRHVASDGSLIDTLSV